MNGLKLNGSFFRQSLNIAMLVLVFCFISVRAYASGNDTYTKLLIHSDTTDGDTIFEDSSNPAHTITPYGDAQHTTITQKFGTSSIAFDGNGDYLRIPDSDDWDFGDGNFTIDFWIKPTELAYRYLLTFGQGNSYPNNWGWQIGLDQTGTGKILLAFGGGQTFFIQNETFSVPCTQGVWQHIAIVRNGEHWYGFLNGEQKWYKNGTIAIPSNGASPLTIGRYYSSSGYDFNGFIDELRISKGIARWTENFTPPAAPYSVCNADYNGDSVIDNDDLIKKQQDVLQELQEWTENCWKLQNNCQ